MPSGAGLRHFWKLSLAASLQLVWGFSLDDEARNGLIGFLVIADSTVTILRQSNPLSLGVTERLGFGLAALIFQIRRSSPLLSLGPK
jgi:hypothetical protein